MLHGDRILVGKTAYRRLPPRVGDVVIFVSPDDRSKMFIKRIAGLPGSRVARPDGTEEAGPHGMVYVLGDNREASVDSRSFGYLPLRDVAGKARQAYCSEYILRRLEAPPFSHLRYLRTKGVASVLGIK